MDTNKSMLAMINALIKNFSTTDLPKQRSLVVRMDITNKCNLRCLHCTLIANRNYRGETYGDMPIELFEKIAKEIFPHAHTVALSCEAEPIMHPHFLDILRIVQKYPGAGYQLITNATLLTEEKVQALFDSNISTITISIDGATSATFEHVRKGGKWDKVEHGIQLIMDKKNALGRGRKQFPHLQISYTLMRSTLNELPAMIELCKKWGVCRLTLQHLYAIPVNNLADESLIHHQQESDKILEQCKQKCIDYGIIPTFPPLFATTAIDSKTEENIAINNSNHSTIDSLKINKWLSMITVMKQKYTLLITRWLKGSYTAYENLPINLMCSAPWQMIRIRWDGTVYPCDLWQDQEAIGNLHTTSFKYIWNNKIYKKLRSNLVSGNISYPNCVRCMQTHLVTTDNLENKKVSTSLAYTPKTK